MPLSETLLDVIRNDVIILGIWSTYGQHESSAEVKAKHLNHPLVADYSNTNKPFLPPLF